MRVLAEGEITERQYLRTISGEETQLEFGDFAGTPLALVQQARQKTTANGRANGFDEIWCVFDVDEHPHVDQAVYEARQSGIRTAVSNPCFELWLVLHVEDQWAHIHRHAIQRRCSDLHLTEGKKIADAGVARLQQGYDAAKQRAQALDRMHEQNGSPKGIQPQ